MGANDTLPTVARILPHDVIAARRLLALAERAAREGSHFLHAEDSVALRLAAIAVPKPETFGPFPSYVDAARRLVSLVEHAECDEVLAEVSEPDAQAMRAAVAAWQAEEAREAQAQRRAKDRMPGSAGEQIISRLDSAFSTLLGLRVTLRMQTFEWSNPLPPRTFAKVIAGLCRVAGEHLEFAHAHFGGGGPRHFTSAALTGPGFLPCIPTDWEGEAEIVRAALFALIGLEGVARLDYAREDVAGFHAVANACVELAGSLVDDALRMFADRVPVWGYSDGEDEPDLSDLA